MTKDEFFEVGRQFGAPEDFITDAWNKRPQPFREGNEKHQQTSCTLFFTYWKLAEEGLKVMEAHFKAQNN